MLRWAHTVTLATLLVGYTGYYICRSSLSVAAPLMLEALGPSGFDRRALGLVTSIGVLCYALGKLANGVAGDFLGGRTLFLLGMIGAVAATLMFGASTTLPAFVLAWAFNRFVQSGGWGGLVKVASQWFEARHYGSVMAVLSLSYLFGDAIGRVLLGQFVSAGMGWRPLFATAAAILTVIAIATALVLRERPPDDGAARPPINPDNVFGDAGDEARPTGLRDLLRPLASAPAFRAVCLVSFGLTLVREAFNLWIPAYLVDVHHFAPGAAAQASALFPFVGGVSTLVAGVLSDRVTNRLGLAWPALIAAVAALFFLTSSSAAAHAGASLVAIAVAAFGLLGPYSLLAGAVALDFGGRRGSATAAGLIDFAGYIGAMLSGYVVGALVDRAGWPAGFALLAVICGLTAVAAFFTAARLAPRPLIKSASGARS